MRGVKEAVTVNVVLAVVDFLSQLALVVAGVVPGARPRAADPQHRATSAPRRRSADFLIAIPIGTVAYTGIETISNMAGEARDEAKTIPAAIKRVMYRRVRDLLHAAVGGAVGAARASATRTERTARRCSASPKEDGGYATDPILGIVENMDLGAIQGAAETYVAVLAVTILVAATNAGVLGVSRLVYSMGIHRQMPDGLRRLHPRFRTPYIGILVFSALACVALLPGPGEFLGSIYAFGAMLSFSMAHLAVIRLRRDAARTSPRPYRSPGACASAGTSCRRSRSSGLAGTVLVVPGHQRARPDGRRPSRASRG